MPPPRDPISTIFLPDILAEWPWPRRLNPYYKEAKAESEAWLESFKAFDTKAQDAFNNCDFSTSISITGASLQG